MFRVSSEYIAPPLLPSIKGLLSTIVGPVIAVVLFGFLWMRCNLHRPTYKKKIFSTNVVMDFKRKFNMEESPPRHVQSLLTGCSNQRQVRTPPWPIFSQGITFKDHLNGRDCSSAELR
ncbi:hypothetical protein CHARACLAT_017709 [Characodon lateralis]|uniref:Uncharacterized protein n=1 Tax=Characodon lateralis TaxID=208331 RepID=A0ABU7E1C3_9TELE|nr:hypothetical protein [Characodon lateralis]